MDPRRLRAGLARFPTGVTVVTYPTDEGPRGATVNAFTSVSLDPPLILVSLARTARACTAMDGRPFAVNVLRCDQRDVALHFAGRPRPGALLAWDPPSAVGTASLRDSVAVLQCRPWRRYDGGDHVLHLGEVVDVEARPGEPLVFSAGSFTTTGLPMLDGPLIHTLDRPPAPGWTCAAQRLHHHADAG